MSRLSLAAVRALGPALPDDAAAAVLREHARGQVAATLVTGVSEPGAGMTAQVLAGKDKDLAGHLASRRDLPDAAYVRLAQVRDKEVRTNLMRPGYPSLPDLAWWHLVAQGRPEMVRPVLRKASAPWSVRANMIVGRPAGLKARKAMIDADERTMIVEVVANGYVTPALAPVAAWSRFVQVRRWALSEPCRGWLTADEALRAAAPLLVALATGVDRHDEPLTGMTGYTTANIQGQLYQALTAAARSDAPALASLAAAWAVACEEFPQAEQASAWSVTPEMAQARQQLAARTVQLLQDEVGEQRWAQLCDLYTAPDFRPGPDGRTPRDAQASALLERVLEVSRAMRAVEQCDTDLFADLDEPDPSVGIVAGLRALDARALARLARVNAPDLATASRHVSASELDAVSAAFGWVYRVAQRDELDWDEIVAAHRAEPFTVASLRLLCANPGCPGELADAAWMTRLTLLRRMRPVVRYRVDQAALAQYVLQNPTSGDMREFLLAMEGVVDEVVDAVLTIDPAMVADMTLPPARHVRALMADASLSRHLHGSKLVVCGIGADEVVSTAAPASRALDYLGHMPKDVAAAYGDRLRAELKAILGADDQAWATFAGLVATWPGTLAECARAALMTSRFGVELPAVG